MTSVSAADVAVQAEAERWPDVHDAPTAPVRGFAARLLLERVAGRVPIRIAYEGAAAPVHPIGSGAPGAPTMQVHRPADLHRRIGAAGLIGFGESYQAGDWDCEDLPGLLTVLAAQIASLVPARLQPLRRLHSRRRPRADANTRTGSRRNIERHYDLSDDLFTLFLDNTLSYSSALFAEDDAGRPIAADGLLAFAQHRKIDRLLDATGVGPGTRVLEIGTGWGELALRAAARGATVRTVTLSQNQRTRAEQRARQAGLDGRVRVELMDYRDLHGEYDAVLSVEMIEAVGREHWPEYFGTLARLLVPGGRVGLQAITMPHDRLLATAGTQTWITKYIFPGGLIPSVRAIEDCSGKAGLRVRDDLAFGPHYAQTLRLWRERFLSNAAQIGDLGFDQTFRRTWDLYLAYCQAGFASGYLDVHQFTLTHGGR